MFPDTSLSTHSLKNKMYIFSHSLWFYFRKKEKLFLILHLNKEIVSDEAVHTDSVPSLNDDLTFFYIILGILILQAFCSANCKKSGTVLSEIKLQDTTKYSKGDYS